VSAVCSAGATVSLHTVEGAARRSLYSLGMDGVLGQMKEQGVG